MGIKDPNQAKELMNSAINKAISESQEVRRALQAIQDAGFEIPRFVIYFEFHYNKPPKQIILTANKIADISPAETGCQPSQRLNTTPEDEQFLKCMKISPK